MRTRSISVLLAAMLILVSGCHKNNEMPREQSTPEAFDLAQAMKMFYGNYDARNQTSTAVLPQWEGSLSAGEKREKQMTVKPLFNTFSSDAGAPSFVLVTYANAPNCVSHACAPTIGMAVFTQQGAKWAMDESNRAVTYLGEWGNPPSAVLVQVGPSHYAVEISATVRGQSEVSKVLQILIPWNYTVNLALERVISDSDLVGCEDEGVPVPCFKNSREINFIRDDKVEYYNLELKFTGTAFTSKDVTPMRVREVNGVEVLKFENGKYVQVSHQGD